MNKKKKTSVEIFVCFHNLKLLPKIKKIIKEKDIYKPLLLGNNCKKNSPEYYCEQDGDNISYLNPFISEISGVYWMSKNSQADIVGLVHYRRYFVKHKYFGNLLNKNDVLECLEDNDIILQYGNEPLKDTNYELYGELLNDAFNVIKNMFPEYINAYNEVMHSKYPLSFFNMFICNKNIINDYCEWIIPILEELSKNPKVSENPRIVGVIGELLFNIYIYHNNFKIKGLYVKFVGNDIKLKLRMFFKEIRFIRVFFKYIYYPIKEKL